MPTREPDDARIAALLRTALPPVSADRPARDLWPRVKTRLARPPAWSWVDVGLAVAAALWLVIFFPEQILLLAYLV